MVYFLVLIFNAVVRTHHIPPVWEYARLISIHKPGKNPAQPTSYRPISLLDLIEKLFEILPTMILLEVGKCELLLDEQFSTQA
jgi:hypothetical protein